MEDGMLPGEALIRALGRNIISHVTLPPAVLAALPGDADFGSIGTLIIAGDVLSEALASRWVRGRRLINAYGPTDGTGCTTLPDYDPEAFSRPSIWRPIANTRTYILDG